MHVPDGLAGERVDSAIARMLGLSRSRAADLIAQDLVQVDGAGAGNAAGRRGSGGRRRGSAALWRYGRITACMAAVRPTLLGGAKPESRLQNWP